MDTTTAAPATCHEVLERFLAGYWTPRTRDNYRFILTRWLNWCHEHRLEPVGGVDATALETFIAELKTAGYAPNTIVGRVSAIWVIGFERGGVRRTAQEPCEDVGV